MNCFGKFLVASALAVSLAACATGKSTETAGIDSSGKVCINVRTINGFNPLSDRELLVTASVRDYYLFTVFGSCPGLRYANTIAVADPTSRICSDGFGKVAFRDAGRGRQVCQVDQIERVASPDEAREIAKAREEARREKLRQDKSDPDDG